jgi:hypothetical protein
MRPRRLMSTIRALHSAEWPLKAAFEAVAAEVAGVAYHTSAFASHTGGLGAG